MQTVNWGRMTQDETEQEVREGFGNLIEETQIKLIKEWAEELGGLANF